MDTHVTAHLNGSNAAGLPRTSTQTTELSKQQLIMLTVLGIVFWFLFVLVIRYTLPLGIYGGVAGGVTFLVTIPAGYGLVVAIEKLARLTTAQLVPGFTLATACAALCDGTALTWMPTLYAEDSAQQVLGAAAILWGAGTTLITAYVLTLWRRQ